MSYLVGTGSLNELAQQMMLALYERKALGLCLTGFADHYTSVPGQWIRARIGRFCPPLDLALRRRRVDLVPPQYLHQRIPLDGIRSLARLLRGPARLEDWLFDRFTFDLDRQYAACLEQDGLTGFLGFEYGSLAGLTTARRLGKPGVLVYSSPHHRLRRQWVDPAFDEFPDWTSPSAKALLALSVQRDALRDAEATQAHILVSISSLITASLVQGGFPAEKIVTVPLAVAGRMPTSEASPVPAGRSFPARFVYAGSIALHKGLPYLLRAWTALHPAAAELHLYGHAPWRVPALEQLPAGVTYHPRVSKPELLSVFRRSTALVFPSLADGYGQVVGEALAEGCPVITTPQAGAAELIQDRKNGFLVPARSSDALAQALSWFLDHPGELAAMRHAARESLPHRTWAHFRNEFCGALQI